MEQEWLRQTRPLELPIESLRAILEPAGFEVRAAVSLTEGKANTNVRVELGDGRVAVLRIYQRQEDRRVVERALYRRLDGVIPVPEILAEGAEWVLLDFLPGRSLQAAAAEPASTEIREAAPEIGAALARIAAIKFNRAGQLGPNLEVIDPWPSPAEGLAGYLEMCLARPLCVVRCGPDLRGSVWQAWETHLPEIVAASPQPCLSHGDYKPSNLLVHGGKLSGVLDWEFAHSGTWLLDAGQILRHRGQLPDAFAGGIAEGLRREGLALPPNWVTLACVVDLVNLVDFLGRETCSEATQAQILGLIDQTVRLAATTR